MGAAPAPLPSVQPKPTLKFKMPGGAAGSPPPTEPAKGADDEEYKP